VNATRLHVNGEPASADDLRWLVANNYGHFTSMRVEQGAVRGLDLHLQRLLASTRQLFGSELDSDSVRRYVRTAIDGIDGALSVRVNVFSRAYDRDNPARSVAADVLVSVNAASAPADGAVRVKSFDYEREASSIKHVGTFPLFHYRRLAQLAGFDDAVFVDRSGRVSEGSIWNIAFIDVGTVVWTQAAQLEGVSKQLLRQALAENGVPQRDQAVTRGELSRFDGAFFTNSGQPVRPIEHIDAIAFEVDRAFVAMLRTCYDNLRTSRI
jgi:branched-subunit amino acid aminotransferase/4-amino-4-deoxychorismate lyase